MSFENDESVVRELVLFTDNDATIYKQSIQPVMKTLLKKIAKGAYDKARGVDAWMFVAEAGARAYSKAFGGTWHQNFPVSIRKAAAKHFADAFDEAVKAGEYDDELAALLPKSRRR